MEKKEKEMISDGRYEKMENEKVGYEKHEKMGYEKNNQLPTTFKDLLLTERRRQISLKPCLLFVLLAIFVFTAACFAVYTVTSLEKPSETISQKLQGNAIEGPKIHFDGFDGYNLDERINPKFRFQIVVFGKPKNDDDLLFNPFLGKEENDVKFEQDPKTTNISPRRVKLTFSQHVFSAEPTKSGGDDKSNTSAEKSTSGSTDKWQLGALKPLEDLLKMPEDKFTKSLHTLFPIRKPVEAKELPVDSKGPSIKRLGSSSESKSDESNSYSGESQEISRTGQRVHYGSPFPFFDSFEDLFKPLSFFEDMLPRSPPSSNEQKRNLTKTGSDESLSPFSELYDFFKKPMKPSITVDDSSNSKEDNNRKFKSISPFDFFHPDMFSKEEDVRNTNEKANDANRQIIFSPFGGVHSMNPFDFFIFNSPPSQIAPKKTDDPKKQEANPEKEKISEEFFKGQIKKEPKPEKLILKTQTSETSKNEELSKDNTPKITKNDQETSPNERDIYNI